MRPERAGHGLAQLDVVGPFPRQGIRGPDRADAVGGAEADLAPALEPRDAELRTQLVPRRRQVVDDDAGVP
jgi:hypothetical protein